MNIPYVFKRCTKCGRWVVANSMNFYKDKNGKYGLNSQCKECKNKYDKKYREEHKEAIAEKNKKYRKQNKEAIAEKNKKYYEENKEVRIEYSKKYYKENKEARIEYNKKYKEENKKAIGEQKKKYRKQNKEVIAKRDKKYRNTPQGQVVEFNKCSRRRAREQNQGSGITKEQWLEMMNFFNWECAYSGKRLTNKTRSIDHITPLNKGGENEIWNCVPMDKNLNSSKNDKEMLEWYTKQPFFTDERLQNIRDWQVYAKNKYANLIVNE